MMMADEPRKNFLGIPVTGDIQHADRRVPQRPLEDLAPLMQAILDDSTVASFGWTQFTPYFNDGDPCIFHVSGGLTIRLAENAPQHDCAKCGDRLSPAYEECRGCFADNPFYDEDYDDDDGVEYNLALGRRYATWEASEEHPAGSYDGPDEARYDRCLALEQAIDSGAFNDVLLEHFGDHCSVMVSRDGVRVSEYSHD
jgi:hypothetical protein